MIYTGENEYPVYLGENEISAIYCGEELIYPVNLGTLTGITIEDLTWVEDVPYSGGTAGKDNCSYKVVAHYDSDKSRTVTSKATVTGSLVVPATTAETREMVGVLQLTATYEGFTATGSVDAYQRPFVEDWSTHYLTFIIHSDGYLRWMHLNDTYASTIQYSKDDGATWTSVTSTKGSDTTTSGGTQIAVSTGDVILFKGSKQSYGAGGYFSAFERTEVEFEVCGNILSMCYGDDFQGKDITGGTNNFRNFFSYCTGLTTPENLILPNSTTQSMYNYMFQNCTFEKAPVLPASNIAQYSYSYMLRRNPNLKYVKCLARTGISTRNCQNWFQECTAVGTFVKYPGTSWSSGISGIPTGWTVIESTE